MFTKLARLLSNGAEPAPDPLRRPLALAMMMVETARADFHQQNEERDTIRRLLVEHCRLDDADAERMLDRAFARSEQAVSLHSDVGVLNDELDHAAKCQLILWLWRVALADGCIDPREEARVRQLAELLYVSHADFVRLRMQAEEESRAAQHVDPQAGRSF